MNNPRILQENGAYQPLEAESKVVSFSNTKGVAMLIEFRIENHRSIREEQVLTFESSLTGKGDGRPRSVIGHDTPLLPAAVIYGANASGKSNVLNALTFMRDAVVSSHRLWEPDFGVPRTPFAWDKGEESSSLFEATFVLNTKRLAYGFVVDDNKVQEEWLFAWPKGRKQVWFERENERFKFGDSLRGENKLIEDITGSNALFLSAAAQHRHEQLIPVWNWFRSLLPVNIEQQNRRLVSRPYDYRLADLLRGGDRQQSLFPDDNIKDDAILIDQFKSLLRASDTGIIDLKFEQSEDDERFKSRRPRFYLRHKHDQEECWLPLSEESRGTRTLFRNALPILEALRKGTVLLVDELESSLHPLLALQILQLFNDPKSNPRNAQILFTTHDTNLLGTILGEPALRRDQVWLSEKTANGSSLVYPLTDYKPRKQENLERGYLQGRYGAIPFLGNFDSLGD